MSASTSSSSSTATDASAWTGPFVLALDQGTTSSRAIVFDARSQVVASAQQEFTQHFPQSGWVEHDAREIWASQLSVAQAALKQAAERGATPIAALGITNQRETCLLWERATGEPIAPAIVWQDRRTVARCEALARDGWSAKIQRSTGLVLDAYFSATKLEWLLDHIPRARERAARGELCFGTIDSWLIFKLTGGAVHATDVSNASRTMLFDIARRAWDASLLQLFRIPAALLPEVRASSGSFGCTSKDLLGAAIPITGVAGDQQAATFGQACFAPGSAKNTYGTGCFMLLNTGQTMARSKNRLLATIGWSAQGQSAAAYCLEGSVFAAGAAVQWLRDGLGIIERAADVEALAESVPDSGDVVFVPALAGLGAPHWDGRARGTLLGLTRGSTRAHIARATLDAIAMQVADVFEAMRADSGLKLTELRVDGGASRNDLLMQLQADVLGVPVLRPAVTETTALGAAYLAGLSPALDRPVWASGQDLSAQWRLDRRFEPKLSDAHRTARMVRWHDAVARARAWAI